MANLSHEVMQRILMGIWSLELPYVYT